MDAEVITETKTIIDGMPAHEFINQGRERLDKLGAMDKVQDIFDEYCRLRLRGISTTYVNGDLDHVRCDILHRMLIERGILIPKIPIVSLKNINASTVTDVIIINGKEIRKPRRLIVSESRFIELKQNGVKYKNKNKELTAEEIEYNSLYHYIYDWYHDKAVPRPRSLEK